jgi:hypothetical protein
MKEAINMTGIYTIINKRTFQEVDILRGDKESIEKSLAHLKKEYPSEAPDLIVMECA